MKRAVIVGGGISGLICSHVFRRQRLDVTVLEPGKPGGEFLAGGLKYIHRTDAMIELFEELDLVYSDYLVQGGIMLRGKVLKYPGCFKDMDPAEAKRIQHDHYRKTRRTQAGEHAATAMNDPASTKPRKALRCDIADLVDCLAERAHIMKAGASRIEAGRVITSIGTSIPYDFLVITIPLWITRGMVDFYIPECCAMRLNVAIVEPRHDKYGRWDYVYTPYTPADYIHRFSPLDSSYAMEMNGEFDRLKLESDLQFIFPKGYYIKKITEGLKGHLLPLKQQPSWPDRVAPLGRFAQWDSRATVDVVIEDSHKLLCKWGVGCA